MIDEEDELEQNRTTFHLVLDAIEICKRYGIIPLQFDHHRHTLFMQEKRNLEDWARCFEVRKINR